MLALPQPHQPLALQGPNANVLALPQPHQPANYHTYIRLPDDMNPTLRRYNLDNDNDDPIFCEQCQTRFPTQAALEDHECSDNLWACGDCGKQFQTKSALKAHKRNLHERLIRDVRKEAKMKEEKEQERREKY